MVDTEVTESEKVEIVDHFTYQLINSGYKISQIQEIILSSLKGMKLKEERKIKRGRRFLSARETLPERLKKKLVESEKLKG